MAAFTGLRQEDAEYAEVYATTTLGYGIPPAHPSMCSHYSPLCYQAVPSNLSGKDPFSGLPIPAWTTVNVGATPVLFMTNRTNGKGLGDPGVFVNLDDFHAAHIFDGEAPALAAVIPMHLGQRIPRPTFR